MSAWRWSNQIFAWICEPSRRSKTISRTSLALILMRFCPRGYSSGRQLPVQRFLYFSRERRVRALSGGAAERRSQRPAFRSNPAKKQKNENDQEDQPQSSGRSVAPVSTVRPPWQRAKESYDQEDDQYSSKHGLLLTFSDSGGAASILS